MKYTLCECFNFLMILKMQGIVLRGNVENICMNQHRTALFLLLRFWTLLSKPAVGSITDPSDLIFLKSRRV